MCTKVLSHAVRYVELGIRVPAVELLGQTHFLGTRRLAMGIARIVLVRRTVADVTMHDDQSWPILGVCKRLVGARQLVKVVGIAHRDDVPAIRCEARANVLGKGELRRALDRDLVVVVDPAQIGELQMTSQGSRFTGDALHYVAIAAKGVYLEVEQRKVGAIECRREPAPGDRHADAVRNALSERTCRRLHARGPAVFGVPGAAATRLAERLEVLHGDGETVCALVARTRCFYFRKIEQRVEHCRSMPVGKYEPIAIDPVRVLRRVAQVALPQTVDGGTCVERRSGMS